MTKRKINKWLVAIICILLAMILTISVSVAIGVGNKNVVNAMKSTLQIGDEKHETEQNDVRGDSNFSMSRISISNAGFLNAILDQEYYYDLAINQYMFDCMLTTEYLFGGANCEVSSDGYVLSSGTTKYKMQAGKRYALRVLNSSNLTISVKYRDVNVGKLYSADIDFLHRFVVNEPQRLWNDTVSKYGVYDATLNQLSIDSDKGFAVAEGVYYLQMNSRLLFKIKQYTIQHNVTFETGGNQNVNLHENFTFPIPTKTDHDFLGWYYGDTQLTDSRGVGLKVWNIDSNATVTAKWNEIEYVYKAIIKNYGIYYFTQNGFTIDINRAIKISKSDFNSFKSGYLKSKISLPVAISGEYISSISNAAYNEISREATLALSWSQEEYDLTLSNVDKQKTMTYVMGDTLLPSFSNEFIVVNGYDFTGWKMNGQLVNIPTTIYDINGDTTSYKDGHAYYSAGHTAKSFDYSIKIYLGAKEPVIKYLTTTVDAIMNFSEFYTYIEHYGSPTADVSGSEFEWVSEARQEMRLSRANYNSTISSLNNVIIINYQPIMYDFQFKHGSSVISSIKYCIDNPNIPTAGDVGEDWYAFKGWMFNGENYSKGTLINVPENLMGNITVHPNLSKNKIVASLFGNYTLEQKRIGSYKTDYEVDMTSSILRMVQIVITSSIDEVIITGGGRYVADVKMTIEPRSTNLKLTLDNVNFLGFSNNSVIEDNSGTTTTIHCVGNNKIRMGELNAFISDDFGAIFSNNLVLTGENLEVIGSNSIGFHMLGDLIGDGIIGGMGISFVKSLTIQMISLIARGGDGGHADTRVQPNGVSASIYAPVQAPQGNVGTAGAHGGHGRDGYDGGWGGSGIFSMLGTITIDNTRVYCYGGNSGNGGDGSNGGNGQLGGEGADAVFFGPSGQIGGKGGNGGDAGSGGSAGIMGVGCFTFGKITGSFAVNVIGTEGKHGVDGTIGIGRVGGLGGHYLNSKKRYAKGGDGTNGVIGSANTARS